MPDFTGLEVIDELEKAGKLKDQKIIILTASNIQGDQITNLLKKGVHSFQKKPLSAEALIQVMCN